MYDKTFIQPIHKNEFHCMHGMSIDSGGVFYSINFTDQLF